MTAIILKKKSKVSAPAEPLTPELDKIEELVHQIESLQKDDAIARVGLLEDDCGQTYFELGGLLCVILKNKWYEPHQSFDAWVEHETAMRRARARALILIYDALVSCQVPWAKVKHLGWTKLRTIASLLTPENADHWIGIASQHSKGKLVEYVRAHKGKSVDAHGEPEALQTKVFKFHSGQAETVKLAIAKMKKEAGAAHDADALGHICKEYVEGPTLPEKLTTLPPTYMAAMLTQALNAREKDAVAEILTEVFKTVVHELEIDPFALVVTPENLPG